MNHGFTDSATAKTIARKLFSSYSQNGMIDGRSMERMLIDTYRFMNKEIKPTQQDLLLYKTILDNDSDGAISVADLENIAVKLLARPQVKTYTKSVKERLQVAKRLFEKFDQDRSGYLSRQQIPMLLIETYKTIGISYTPTTQDIDSWMQMTDLDGDGKVNLEDYERLIITSLEKCGIRIYQRT